MSRKTHFYLISIATAFCVSAVGCSSSNEPASGNPKGEAGAPSAAAGTPSTAAGAPSDVAGAPSAAAGTPSTSGGAGGATGGAGAPAAAGATAAAGAGATTPGTPLCSAVPVTAGKMEVPSKGIACGATDTKLCYKTCGPQGVGFKTETCDGTAYQEDSNCFFPPDADYSCFKIPTAQNAACPATTITANTACTVAMCNPCTDATGHYFDTSNNMKVGYCVCPAPGASGMSKWSCASTTAWPCPAGKGCQ